MKIETHCFDDKEYRLSDLGHGMLAVILSNYGSFCTNDIVLCMGKNIINLTKLIWTDNLKYCNNISIKLLKPGDYVKLIQDGKYL